MKARVVLQMRRLVLAGLVVSVLFVTSACSKRVPPHPEYEKKIAYYSGIIAKEPASYPSFAMLGAAYLEKARDTGNPDDLAKARASALRSVEIQQNYEAFKTLAKIEGFAHKFRESIEWAEKASAAAVDSRPDPETASILVESYLGFGELENAERVVSAISEKGFFRSAAMANVAKARHKDEKAAAEFLEAARFALMQNAADAQAWALVMAAGVWIDAGRPDKALEYIEKAEKISPESKAAAIHRAEYLDLKGRTEESVDVYEKLLKSSDDGEIHRRLYLLMKKLGRADEAEFHFRMAERRFRRVIDAGEIYTLGPFAQMLCDAGIRLDEAKQLSAENLKFKRDTEAMKTEACLRSER